MLKRYKTENGIFELGAADAYVSDDGLSYQQNGKYVTGKLSGENGYAKWDTTAAWRHAINTYSRLYAMYTSADVGLDTNEIDIMHDAESYIEDESNACDWSKKPRIIP